MAYAIQILIFVSFLFAGYLIRACNRGALAYRRYRKKKRADQEYLEAEKTTELLLNEFHSRPILFESYVAAVFESAGYEQVTVTKAVNDGGKDLIMYKNKKKYVAEVKLYRPQYRISRERIQKLHSAMLDTEADGACFVTTSDFTQNAVVYAGKHGIDLINGYLFGRFVRLLEQEDKKGKNQLLFLHEMMKEDSEALKKKNEGKAWLLMGSFLAVYPVYSIGCLYLINSMEGAADRSYMGMLALLIFLNAINLRIFVKCLIRYKSYCGCRIKSV
ncbi:MAG: restriction endonuclease [Lachnospiraceae bacterium]